MADLSKVTLERILEQAQKLPITTSELVVVPRDSYQKDYLINQIGTMSAKDLSDIIYAIAERIGDLGA